MYANTLHSLPLSGFKTSLRGSYSLNPKYFAQWSLVFNSKLVRASSQPIETSEKGASKLTVIQASITLSLPVWPHILTDQSKNRTWMNNCNPQWAYCRNCRNVRCCKCQNRGSDSSICSDLESNQWTEGWRVFWAVHVSPEKKIVGERMGGTRMNASSSFAHLYSWRTAASFVLLMDGESTANFPIRLQMGFWGHVALLEMCIFKYDVMAYSTSR